MLEIRRGVLEDINALATLYDELNDYLESHINYPGWRKGIYPVREDAEQGIRENTLFVALRDGHIVGTVILRHCPENGYELADWHNSLDYKNIFVLYTFAVHPYYLNQGIGKKILEFVIDHAAQMKMKAIRLDVYEKNIPAIRLYESMGFQYIATVDLGYSMYGLEQFKLYQYLL